MKRHVPREGAQQPEFAKFEQSDHSAERQGSKNYTVKQHENTKTQQKIETMTIQSDIGLQDKRLKRDRMMRKNTVEDQETIQCMLRLRRSPLDGLQTAIMQGKLRAKRNQPDNTLHEQLVEALQKMLL